MDTVDNDGRWLRVVRALPRALAGLAAAVSMQTFAADVGLLGAVQGSVRIETPGQPARPALAYTQLRAGDTVSVGADGKAQIILTEQAREEWWPAGSRVRIDAAQTTPLAGAAERTGALSPLLVRQLKQTPGSGASTRVGMVRLRGLSEMRMQEIMDSYAQLRSQFPQGNYLAEVYVLNAMIAERDYSNAAAFLNQLITSAPRSEGVRQLAEKYRLYLETDGAALEATASGSTSAASSAGTVGAR